MKKLLLALAVIAGTLFASQAHAAVTIDVSTSTKASAFLNNTKTTVTSTLFTTSNTNELLLAIFSEGNNAASSSKSLAASGSGLTWVLAAKSVGAGGSVDIFRAFSASTLSNASVTIVCTNCSTQAAGVNLTVLSFAGVDTTGSSGAGAIGATSTLIGTTAGPSSTLTTTRDGSWVVGGIEDFLTARVFSAGSNQTIVSQENSGSGDTELSIRQNATTPTSGTKVTLNATPTSTDQWNEATVEILAAPAAAATTAPVMFTTWIDTQ